MQSIFEQNKKEILQIIKNDPQNKICADCRIVGTTFADVKVGCFLCIMCAGIHRQFGTDICRIKSVNLDNFTTEELSMFTFTRGNIYVNKIYEGNMTDSFKKTIMTYFKNQQMLKDFIKRKYVIREFYVENQNLIPHLTEPTVQQHKLTQSQTFKNIKIKAPQQTKQLSVAPKIMEEDLLFFDPIDNSSVFDPFGIEENKNKITNNTF